VQRRHVLGASLAAALPAPQLFAQAAAGLPADKPIRMVVPFSPGGGLDLVARSLSDGVGKRLQRPVIVENKPGGNTVIATQYVAGAPADGTTIYLTLTVPYSMLPAMSKRPLPYDPAAFTSVAVVAESALGFAVPATSPFKTLRELFDAAKASPGKYTYGSSGATGIPNLTMELIKAELGVQMLQIPFQGGGPAAQAAAAGQVDLILESPSVSAALVQAGRLRILAISGTQKVPALPMVPTLAEAGYPQIEIPPVWFGFVGPAKMPRPVAVALHEAITAEAQTPEIAKTMAGLWLFVKTGGVDDVGRMIETDKRIWGNLIRKVGITMD